MLFYHIKISLRNLLTDHVYAIINIGGLGLGIAASIMLLMWVQDELSYDSFHSKGKNIYRVNANFNNNGQLQTWSSTPGPVASYSKAEVPGIAEALRIRSNYGTQLYTYNDITHAEGNISAYVDNSFFKVFDFELIKGNADNPFPDNNSIIISEKIAAKYFGDAEPIGKIISIDKTEYAVVGLMREMPHNSSIKYDVLLPFQILIDTYQPNDYWKSLESDWGNYYISTFLLLNHSAKTENVAQQLTDIHRKHQQEAKDLHYTLQPVTKLHLYSADMKEAGMQTVRIFLVVAIVMLVIASINYINLTTARATQRAKEVGVRKTIGADRTKLIAQFLVESALITAMAIFFAILLIQVSIPVYNELSGKQLNFEMLYTQNALLFSGLIFGTWLLSGLYPAIVLSSFQPMQIIRGKLSISGGNSTFRKILVVTQFSLSIAIIIGTVIVGHQLDFIKSKKLGYDKENVFTFGMRGEMFGNVETIRTELLKHPGIVDVSFANANILNTQNATADTDWEGKDPDMKFIVRPLSVSSNFMDMLQLELVEGEGFKGGSYDSLKFILNETAVKKAGIENPIGKTFSLWREEGTIIGVVKDFHHNSLHENIEPAIFFVEPEWLGYVYVKLNGSDFQGGIAAAENIWKQYNADYPFYYNFLDDSYNRMYQAEQRMSKLFIVFSTITILISCMGLFGLATFTANQRIKEIGIRKVMGATVSQIVLLLSKDFMLLVSMAILLAAPVSYFSMEKWLQDFAYRIDISWAVFVIAGGIALLIAMLTVSFHTVKAAMANPASSLRTE